MTSSISRHRTARVLLTALTATFAVLFVGVSTASAGISFAPSIDIPLTGAPVTIGQTDVASQLTIQNVSTVLEVDDEITLTMLTVVPACAAAANTIAGGNCPPGFREPNVLEIDAVAFGRDGTACEGQTFNVNNISADQDKYEFVPTIGSVVLGAANGPVADATCIIDFFVDVIQMPNVDVIPGTPNPDTRNIVYVEGQNDAVPAEAGSSQQTNNTEFLRADIGLSTVASTNPPTFTELVDTATLGPIPGNAVPPTGDVEFQMYGPFPEGTADNVCTGVPQTQTVPVPAVGLGATEVEVVSDPFTPTGPGEYHFIAIYSGDGNYEPFASACGDPNESVTIPAPDIEIVKTVDPAVMLAPGGDFEFTLVVTNDGPIPITITELDDSIYGDLFDPANPEVTDNTCLGLEGDTLAPGASTAPCTFVGNFTGAAGDTETDTATVTGEDANGFPATDSDDAVVELVPVPTVQIVKTVDPGVMQAPGGDFEFTLVITNTGPTTLTLTELNDSIYGDLFDAANPDVTDNTCLGLDGDTLAPGASTAPCTFVGEFTGAAGDTETDVATIDAVDENGFPATDDDDAVVELVPVPTVQIVKTVDPGVMQAPGGDFEFTLVITNTGPTTLTLTELNDSIYGDLFDAANPDVTDNTCLGLEGDTLAPGASTAPCTFVGEFTGAAGDTETDVATIDAVDENGFPATDDDDAVVELVPVPTVQIVKTVDPGVMQAPGGDFEFTLVITNTGPTTLTLTELNDSIYGDLFDAANPDVTDNTCLGLEGDTLAPGASTAPCTFVGEFTGAAGDTETDVATIDAVDENGFPATDDDDAVVELVPVPTVQIVKTVDPGSMQAPGGDFTFTLVITNTGPTTLTLTELNDSIYGDLFDPANPDVTDNTCLGLGERHVGAGCVDGSVHVRRGVHRRGRCHRDGCRDDRRGRRERLPRDRRRRRGRDADRSAGAGYRDRQDGRAGHVAGAGW